MNKIADRIAFWLVTSIWWGGLHLKYLRSKGADKLAVFADKLAVFDEHEDLPAHIMHLLFKSGELSDEDLYQLMIWESLAVVDAQKYEASTERKFLIRKVTKVIDRHKFKDCRYVERRAFQDSQLYHKTNRNHADYKSPKTEDLK